MKLIEGNSAPLATRVDPDLFGVTIPIDAQIKCVLREIHIRQKKYPSWVARGMIRETQAAHELAAMNAVLETLRIVKSQGSTMHE